VSEKVLPVSGSYKERSLKDYWGAIKADPVGVHYALRVVVGGTTLWVLLRYFADTNPIWAISSMIACTEPHLQSARINFRARLANTCIGGAMGLLFVLVAGPRHVVLPLALGATVLVSSYVFQVPRYWRIAPTTAALVVASSLEHQSRSIGLQVSVHRVIEVMLGSFMAVIVAYVMARIWEPHTSTSQDSHANI
jgi:uncharacterized membrane protein YccC